LTSTNSFCSMTHEMVESEPVKMIACLFSL
jgi:hypothetical protein